MLKLSEIRGWDEKLITAKVEELKHELFTLKIEKRTTSLDKSHKLNIAKRNVARLLTVLREKKAGK